MLRSFGRGLSIALRIPAAHDLRVISARTWTRARRKRKPRPNDRNMPTQHIATLLGTTCCVRLATVLRCVATCWVLLAQIWNRSNLSQQHPTCRNTSQHVAKRTQHVAPNNVATCCVGMLWSFDRGLSSLSIRLFFLAGYEKEATGKEKPDQRVFIAVFHLLIAWLASVYALANQNYFRLSCLLCINFACIKDDNGGCFYSQTKWSVPLKIALMNWLFETWTR